MQNQHPAHLGPRRPHERPLRRPHALVGYDDDARGPAGDEEPRPGGRERYEPADEDVDSQIPDGKFVLWPFVTNDEG